MRVQTISLATLILSALTATATESRLADAAEKSDRAAVHTLLKQRADGSAVRFFGGVGEA